MQSRLTIATHAAVTFSDHDFAPLIQVKFQSTLRPSKTLWKLNDSLLSLTYTKICFKHTVEKWLEKPLRHKSPLIWWDKFKCGIKSLFQKIGASESYIRKRKKNFNSTSHTGSKTRRNALFTQRVKQIGKTSRKWCVCALPLFNTR